MERIRKIVRRHRYWLMGLGMVVTPLLILLLSVLLFAVFPSGSVFAVGISLIFGISFFAPQLSQIIYGDKPYTGKHRKMLMGIADSAGYRIGRISVTESDSFAASSFGLFGNTTVCFTRRTLTECTSPELKCVMAHEIAHHRNGDIVSYTAMAMLIPVAGRIIGLAPYSWLGWILPIAVAGIFAGLAFMRWRENEADRFSRDICQGNHGLAVFLKRVVTDIRERGVDVPEKPHRLLRLLGTHPWITDRIAMLDR